ncbi:MAG TPA: rhodanese-like domain-containing protein, partial [Blastococcus sp.]|nr:rhodanese-like domain-containing protein [Blastococcus sp.]
MPTHVPTDPTPADTSGRGRQVVDAATLRRRLQEAAAPRLLDVRTPAEFETAHIAGAYNVPLDTLKEHREEIATHLDEDVVLVCRSGQRAGQAEQALAAAGLPNVRILDGGMQAWERAGGEVSRGRQRWDLERQVRLAAGSLVFTSVLASAVVPRLKWLAGGIGAGLGVAAV